MSGARLVVGALVVDALRHPTQVLAARRMSPPELAGRWEFPGGKVEACEMPREALRRELLEELGVGVTVGTELVRPDGGAWPISERFELRLFYATVVEGQPRPGDSHDEVRWLDAATLESVCWLESDRAALRLVFG